jgi:hypothetical protein
MMATGRSWIVLGVLCAVLLGGCSALAGGVDHWPGSAAAVALIVAGKAANDRVRLLKWPMEFAFWAAILMIACSLVYLHFKPLP